jgi:hypothetical protein
MANANTPFGLKPVKMQGSGVLSGGLETMYVPASDSTALFIGDPVIKAGSADANGIPSVTRAATTGAITGVVQGFLPDATGTVPKSRAASTAAYVLVSTDPNMVYEIQNAAGLTAADVGLNANLASGSGSTVTGLSGFQLDDATKATTSTLQLKILGAPQRPDNAFGANNKVLVKINNSTEVAASAGV